MTTTKKILHKDGRPKYMMLRLHRDGGIEVRAIVYRGGARQFYRSYTVRSVSHVKDFFLRLIDDLVQCKQLTPVQARTMRTPEAYAAWFAYYGPKVSGYTG